MSAAECGAVPEIAIPLWFYLSSPCLSIMFNEITIPSLFSSGVFVKHSYIKTHSLMKSLYPLSIVEYTKSFPCSPFTRMCAFVVATRFMVP